MIKRLYSFCKANQLIFPSDIVFIAVSGGMDSMALLHAFLELTSLIPLHIKAVHINHGVRGAEADRDEQLVRAYCRQNKVELVVRKLEGFHWESSEDALRQARYQAFEAILKQNKNAKLATAHTLNDNIETLLMRLAKGSSLRGLAGIPLKRGPFIRPFLFLKRSEIEDYIQQNNIPYAEDSTNVETRYLRNRIRWRLLPAFREVFGDEFYKGMARSLNELNAYRAVFEKEFARYLPDVVMQKQDRLVVHIEKYGQLEALYRYRLIDYCISAYYPLNYSVSRAYTKRIDEFIRRARTGAKLNVFGNLVLFKDRTDAVFMEQPGGQSVLHLDAESVIRFGKYELEIRNAEPHAVRFTKDKNIEYICGTNIRFPLIVRRWQAGDRFYPLGLGESQKVKKFFIDQKINRSEKKEIPILCNGNEIVWIGGLRLDERYRVKENCKKVYRLTLKKVGK